MLNRAYSLRKFRKSNIDAFKVINLTPIIDLMCVLLIIFMILSNKIFANINVNLPQISSETNSMSSDIQYIVITYLENNVIYVNDQQIKDKKDMINIIQSLQKTNNKTQILIKGDINARYGNIIEIINILNQNGYQDISFLGNKVTTTVSTESSQ